MFGSASDKNLLITGYTGPGQQAVVRGAAERLRMPLVHFEARLETRAEMPLDEFRRQFGETRLRTLENDILDEITLARGSVLYISGHVLAGGLTLDRFSGSAVVLCLTAALDVVLRRLHVAMGSRYHDPAARDQAIGVLRREWAVRGRPGVVEIDTSGLSEAAVLDCVIARWRELSGAIDRGRL